MTYLLIRLPLLLLLLATESWAFGPNRHTPEKVISALEPHRNTSVYAAQMDASMKYKYDQIMPGVKSYMTDKGISNPRICDIGTGTGTLARLIADEIPNSQVVGTDLMQKFVDLAKQNHGSGRNNNLLYALKENGALDSCSDLGSTDINILSSVLHEVYSYSGNRDDIGSVQKALTASYDSLKRGGRIIIRDFIAPAQDDKRMPVILRHKTSNILTATSSTSGQSREMNCENFAEDFKAVLPKERGKETRQDILCKEVTQEIEKKHPGLCGDGYRCFKTNLSTAYEFIYRKDYSNNYFVELHERYGFLDKNEAIHYTQSAGFEIQSLTISTNPWIEEHSLIGNVQLLDPSSGTTLEYPNYQIVIIADKKN